MSLRCSAAWIPYTSSRPLNAAQQAARERWSKKTARLCLLAVMCVASALDMHAAARRDSSLQATLATALDASANAISRETKIVADGAVNQKRTDLAARKDRRPRASQRSSRVASAASRFRGYTKDEVKTLIRVHAAAYGIDASLPLAIAHCESGFKWNASNSRSSARGVFQYLSGTWRTTPEGRKGTSVFNTEAHVRMAVAHIATLGTAAWNASRGCWTKIPSAEFEPEPAAKSETETPAATEPEPADASVPTTAAAAIDVSTADAVVTPQ